jgi:hypothetical protein
MHAPVLGEREIQQHLVTRDAWWPNTEMNERALSSMQ